MTDRERSQDPIDEEEPVSGTEFGSLSQDPEGGGDGPTTENDPPIISSGG